MNDYKEMSIMYEAVIGQRTRDTSRAYPPMAAPSNQTLGRNLPFTGNGHGGAYDAGIASSSHVISDEEGKVDPSTFMRNDILKKIESLMVDAESFEDTKTLIALGELKSFVENL